MAVAYGTVTQSGLLSQQYPPPLLPKPGKDNLRLQKLLKRTAKKKASAQTSQSATPFRSSLSPVNEASPDLEHSDHSTPPRTPETQPTVYGIQQPPRFTVRPLYQHVASPYPQRAAYGRTTRLSPQMVAMPSYSYSQHVTMVSSYSASANISGVSASVGQATDGTVHESKKPPLSAFTDTHVGLRPSSAAATLHSKPTSPGPTPYPVPGSQALIRPLTVLTPLSKSRSPRPTFKATEPSKSPKPMFDVPKIRMYTASTSFYETSRTPPVYDTAGLTAIGSTAPQSKTSMETKQDLTPASEVGRSTTAAAQLTLLDTDSQSQTPTTENRSSVTPTGDINTIRTATSEVKGATPLEIKRATPTSEIKAVTQISEIKAVTQTSEIKAVTQTSEIKAVTQTSEMKRATPTDDRVKTPTYEFQTSRLFDGRPKTPAYHKARATTPVFEISRPNPLLFAVSPITVETERSRTSQSILTASTSSISQTVKTAELSESLPNGDIHSEIIPAVKPVQKSITKSKSEPDLRGGSPTVPAGSEKPKTQASVLTAAAAGYQRPKTPTFEASRLMTISPGYKRPKTPTYGASASTVSHLTFQRPKTPVSQKSKSAYRGLTPAEYAAYGGIKTYSPAFGISGSTMPTQDEEFKDELPVEISQQASAKEEASMEVSKRKETPKDVDKLHKEQEKVASTPSVPIIVVSQASDSPGTMLPQEISMVSAPKHDTSIKETPKPSTTVWKVSEKEEKEQPKQEAKPKTTETKNSLPKGGDKDPMMAVKKLFGKEKVQTTKEKAPNNIKADLSVQKEPIKLDSKIKPEGSKPGPTAPALLVKVPAAESRTTETEKDKKAETTSADKAPSSLENKEADENLKAAETLLKVMQKPKGMKVKTSGWSRLKEHMVVEQEEPRFPETGSQKEVSGQDQREEKILQEKPGDMPSIQDKNQTKEPPKATKMWDAVLFQMFSSKENIMHQIELNKSEEEKKDETKDEPKEIPSFAYRLPVLLFSPKFDAKKLREAASRPVTKISTVFEMGLIGRKGKDEEPKDFNRTARGFAAT